MTLLIPAAVAVSGIGSWFVGEASWRVMEVQANREARDIPPWEDPRGEKPHYEQEMQKAQDAFAWVVLRIIPDEKEKEARNWIHWESPVPPCPHVKPSTSSQPQNESAVNLSLTEESNSPCTINKCSKKRQKIQKIEQQFLEEVKERISNRAHSVKWISTALLVGMMVGIITAISLGTFLLPVGTTLATKLITLALSGTAGIIGAALPILSHRINGFCLTRKSFLWHTIERTPMDPKDFCVIYNYQIYSSTNFFDNLFIKFYLTPFGKAGFVLRPASELGKE